jgi:hypothetical protein
MRILSRSKSGQPTVKREVQNWPVRQFRNPVVSKRSVRTLIKTDQSKGVRSKDWAGITDQKGVNTGRGFTSSPTIMHQKPLTPPSFGAPWRKSIKPPRLGRLQKRSRGT